MKYSLFFVFSIILKQSSQSQQYSIVADILITILLDLLSDSSFMLVFELTFI